MELVIPENIPLEGESGLEGIDFISTGEQYLTFYLAEEQYAVNILSVQEIRGWEVPTLIPRAEPFIKGVINIRGVIIPVADLRIRFRLGEASCTPVTVVIVLSLNVDGRVRTVGFIADAMSDVINAEEHEIKNPPAFEGNVSRELIKGLVNSGKEVITLLDVDKLMALIDEEAI